MFASGISPLVHVAQQKVDTRGQRSQLDQLLASASVLELRSSETTEASLEYLIGLCAELAHGDVQKNLDTLKDRLAGLVRTKESLLARMAGADPSVLSGLADQLAAVEVEIKDVLRQIQAIEKAEENETDSVGASGDNSGRIEAQLEKTAQAYDDMLNSIRL